MSNVVPDRNGICGFGSEWNAWFQTAVEGFGPGRKRICGPDHVAMRCHRPHRPRCPTTVQCTVACRFDRCGTDRITTWYGTLVIAWSRTASFISYELLKRSLSVSSHPSFQEIKLTFPNSQRVNRGGHDIKTILQACKAHDVRIPSFRFRHFAIVLGRDGQYLINYCYIFNCSRKFLFYFGDVT